MNQTQTYGLIVLGAIFWGAAALKIRYLGHVLYANDLRRVSVYIAAVPLGYSIMRFSETIFGISSRQRLTSTAIMCATALMLDGIAFMWFPKLYENPSLQKKNSQLATVISRMGAAWLLWGVGVCLSIPLMT